MNATTTTEAPTRRPPPRELAKILADCRDLAVHRLMLAFSSMLDRVGDLLMDRAGRTDVRDEQSLYLDARALLKTERSSLMAEFEQRLRRRVDDRIAGREDPKADFATVDSTKLTLVDTSAMDESVVTGNITRIVENACHDELAVLNRGFGHLLGRPDLETADNPIAPATIVDSFTDALRQVKTESRIKFQILKELNQASLGDIASIYGDINRHLANLRVMPSAARSSIINRAAADHRRQQQADARDMRELREARERVQAEQTAAAEVDVMALFRRMFGNAASVAHAMPTGGMPQGMGQGMPQGMPSGMPPGMPQGMPWAPREGGGGPMGGAPGEFPEIAMPGGLQPVTFAPMAPTPSGYVPGAPIIATPVLHEGLTRLQAGQSSFDLGGGATVHFSGIPDGLHNVLRDLQESPLGRKANQLESMTIEMVAMLFDFIFETRDLPDGIKALLARLQIPVLKAAMLDGAFFAKKSHPSRLLVNALAAAGRGWSPAMGNDDPLYRKIDAIVHRILDGFSDDLAIFDELRLDLEAFLAEEERNAEANINSSAEEINLRDRAEIAANVARGEVERRIEASPVPKFLAGFLRERWQPAMGRVYAAAGDDSEAWGAAVSTLEDLVWSVQPKRTAEDRKHLVALLPSLLKRLTAGVQGQSWPPEVRESFMSNLVEAHAAAVKPTYAHVESPTAAVAEAAKVQAEVAKAAGDTRAAQQAEALAEAMAPAEPAPPVEEPVVVEDQYLEIARSLERGMWIEFEGDDGQLAFAKLAWISPLRGTYLFTNRQGQKALSMTAEELAERFRADRARPVEAEPLLDRALTTVMGQLEGRLAAEPA
ncbi:MAG TPA: DUF1631 domain-containing protein [Casimicrobiaceae bacterium]|nr:DUF1631 domain-containing protein [Casimicrobiaceae bacterium]